MPRLLEIYTINDLPEEAQHKINHEFIDRNRGVLLKYLSPIQIAILSHECLSFFCGRLREIKIPEEECKKTSNVFSRPFPVPKMLELMGKLLLDSKLENSEIFRVNSTTARVEELIGIVKQMTTEQLSRMEGMRLIESKYTMVDIAEAYKILFKKYKYAVVPQAMLKMIIRVEKIADAGDKHLCAKALVFSLPGMNRRILETCVYVSRRVAERLEAVESQKKMNLSGLAIVLMPNLLRPEYFEDDYCEVKMLSNFLCYLFENFEDLVRI